MECHGGHAAHGQLYGVHHRPILNFESWLSGELSLLQANHSLESQGPYVNRMNPCCQSSTTQRTTNLVT